MSLSTLFNQGLEKLSRQQTALLGDRSTYLGASDLAKCPRKVVMEKTFPVHPPIDVLLRFQRGHQVEDMLDKVFTASGAMFERQVAVQSVIKPIIMCHVDFLFRYSDSNGKSCLHALEIKSISASPSNPQESWESQLYTILGLLNEQYRNSHDVQGSIVAVNMNTGEIQFWNGYSHDKATYNYLFSKADHILASLEGKEEARAEPSALCSSYCNFRDTCPPFVCPSVKLPDDVHQLLEQYTTLNDVKNKAEKNLKGLREEIIEFTGPQFKGRSEGYSLHVTTVEGGFTVDSASLREFYPEIFLKVQKPRSAYNKVDVRPIKKTPQQLAA